MGNSTKMRMRAPLGLAILLVGLGAMSASADTLYSDIPVYGGPYVTGANPNLPNVGPGFDSSIPFDIDQVSSFGGLVNLAAVGPQTLTGGTVALDNYATHSEYFSTACVTAGVCSSDGTGYYANVTVTTYGVGSPGTNPVSAPYDTLYPVTTPVQSTTTSNVFIPWVPTTGNGSNGTCEDNQQAFNTGNGAQCGVINLVNFDLAATVPSSFIYTVSLNNDFVAPLGDTPVDSLNFAMNAFAAGDPGFIPYIGLDGTNVNTGTVGTSDSDTAYYAAACGSGLNPLVCGSGVQGDVGWGSQGYGAISFQGSAATPEPATFGLIGFGLVGLGFVARKKKNKKV